MMNKKNNHLFFYMTYVMFSQNFYGTTKFLENVFPFRFNWQRNTIEEEFFLCLYDMKLNDFRWLIIAKKMMMTKMKIKLYFVIYK